MGVPNRTVTLLVILGIFSCGQASNFSDPTYQAGIVEFIPADSGQPIELVKDNLERMLDIFESDEIDGLDILVFPEYSITNMDVKSYVPDPKDLISPCETTNYDYVLTVLSCAARSRRVYLVVNLLEKELCTATSTKKCDKSGLNTYNTNVVMDREGRVISRYRKSHLYRYEWYTTNVLAEPELATFTTDFGVTFGHFICFDMLFYNPAQRLIDELNITDIIYPTYWYSELPFLTATQLQEGWAYGNDVNLLAADTSIPSEMQTGSGIYAGRFGHLAVVANDNPETVVLRAEVPKIAHRAEWTPPIAVEPAFVPQLETSRLSKINLRRDFNVDLFSTKLLPTTFTTLNEKVCHNNFCCEFNGKRTYISGSSIHSAYRYRLVAYDGSNTTFQQIDPSELAICAVITCTNDQLYSCGRIFPDGVRVGNKYYFNTLNVTGSFRHAERRLIMPSTVNARMLPLSVDQFEMLQLERESSTWVSMTLTVPNADLLTFGIYVNYFSMKPRTHNLDHIDWHQQISSMATSIQWGARMVVSLCTIFWLTKIICHL